MEYAQTGEKPLFCLKPLEREQGVHDKFFGNRRVCLMFPNPNRILFYRACLEDLGRLVCLVSSMRSRSNAPCGTRSMRCFRKTAERYWIWRSQHGRCALCGEDLGIKFSIDHIKPYSLGGQTILANGQATCARCNLQKGTRDDSQILS